MRQADRRRFRRTKLRLRLARLEGLRLVTETADLWTADVSAGGMCFCLPLDAEPELGTSLTFELSVPPGEGYSSSGGKARGSGKVVRTQPAPTMGVGVAVEFTKPLALDF
ncbi:MAG TPA: PilZ domain-containing protein [Phycisphaerae bacterium]|nr:PilZ domain-containing protein [Phycisphaerae bacterium]